MSTFLLAVFQLFCIAEVNGCTGLIASVKNLLAPCKAGTGVLSEEAMESPLCRLHLTFQTFSDSLSNQESIPLLFALPGMAMRWCASHIPVCHREA